jgi:hypothetical protein
MGPRKKKTAEDNKKKNLKDPPAEDPFPDWPPPSLQPSKVLERSHILQRAVIYPDYIYRKENQEEL